MGTPTQVCVWSCPNFSAPPGRPFSYEAQHGYNANEFKIEIHNQDNHVVTPAEFMQGCLKKMVGMIRSIEPCMQEFTAYNMKVDGVILVVKHVTQGLLLFQQKELLLQETKNTYGIVRSMEKHMQLYLGFIEYEVEDEVYTSESNQMNEDAEDAITSPHNE
ncbi:hypothetical protein Tco_0179240 [Tanacetum coccineum]